jgi:hypothetical protein
MPGLGKSVLAQIQAKETSELPLPKGYRYEVVKSMSLGAQVGDIRAEVGKRVVAQPVETLQFRDAAGRLWRRDKRGRLSQQRGDVDVWRRWGRDPT